MKLPAASQFPILVNGKEMSNGFTIGGGNYEICYQPDHDFIGHYQPESSINEIMADDLLVEKLSQVTDTIGFFKNPDNQKSFGEMSLAEVNSILPFINISDEEMKEINQILTTTPLLSERKK